MFIALFPYKSYRYIYCAKQGCKISPPLSSIYINYFAIEINNLSCGFEIGLYADDIPLICPKEQSLQALFD